MPDDSSKIENFQFRDLHPNVFIGTASDRYAGWIGQIYTRSRYINHITRRTKKVGANTFVEDVLPVESVEEYFEHFRVLEIDFTFYRPLLDKNGKPTQNYHVLRTYCQHLKEGDRLILKVPQTILAKKMRRGDAYVENEQYLNPDVFIRQFYKPVTELLDELIGGFIFEQEYQRKNERLPTEKVATELDEFFSAVPRDIRYHVELRTEIFLSSPMFSVFEKHGLGQVLSHWTWLPSLSKQFALSGHRFLSADNTCIVRLMTPLGVRYEDAYTRAHPFSALVDGMLNHRMIKEPADLMQTAVNQGSQINVIINNRYGGNAPLTAQHIARQFLSTISK